MNSLDHDARFRETVRQAPVGITVLRGKELIAESANEAYLQLIGKSEKDFIGKPLFESLPEVRASVEPLLMDVLSTGNPFYANEFGVTLNRFGRNDVAYFNLVYQALRENNRITGIIVVANEVTAQVLDKYKLQESENSLRNIIDHSPFCMTILRGQDYVIEMANDILLNTLWKRKADEVIGKKLLEVFPELNGQAYPQLLKKVMETKIAHKENEAVAYIDSAAGRSKYYLDFEYSPLFGTDRNVSGILISVHDVTEKVMSRDKIRSAEQSLRLAIEATNMGTFDWNFADDMFISSPRLKEIFGFEGNSKATHLDLISTFHPDDKPIRDKAVENSRVTGSLSYEIRIIWRNGSVHWIKVYGKLIFEKDKPLRMYGTALDTTNQKNTFQELIENEARFRLLADSMPQFVWTGDEAGTLNYFNQSVYNYSGLTAQQVTEQGWLQIVHHDDRDENVRLWMESIATGKDFLCEHRFKRHDGEYRWQLSRAVPLRSASGKIQMWVGTSTDIHDHKLFSDKLELEVQERTRELTDSNAALLKSNDELAQFAYVASHDLQEPLRKIQTFSERLMDFELNNLSSKGKDYLARMVSSASRMQKLILDLLSYSRISSPDQLVERLNLNVVMTGVLEQLKDQIENKEAIIHIATLPTLHAISFQVEQMFINILMNSLKYSKEDGKPEIWIESSLMKGADVTPLIDDRSHDYFEIKIRDNGIGFEPQFNKRVFQVFQRLHGRKEYEGTGVGLAICKKIMDNHKGYIFAEGRPNEGVTFSIYFRSDNYQIS